MNVDFVLRQRVNKPQARAGSAGPYCLPLSPGGGTAGAAVTAATSASAWTYGAWVTVVSSTAAALLVEAALLVPSTGGIEGQVQIGVGGAGAEVAVATLPFNVASVVGVFVPIPLYHFPLVASGARIATRALSGTAGAANVLVKLQVINYADAQ